MIFSDYLNEGGPNIGGTIYICSTYSTMPEVFGDPNIYKIGVTNRNVQERLGEAPYDPAFLMAEAKLEKEFSFPRHDVYDMEKYLHNYFAKSQLKLKVKDNDGKIHDVTEWFLVPLETIVAVINNIQA